MVNKNIGTVSDEKGYFILEVNPETPLESELKISMLGYEPKSFTLEGFIQKNTVIVSLEEKSTALEEVVLTAKRTEFETKTLGNKTNSKLIYVAFTTNKLGN